jgi:hypothetical protein
MADVPLPLMLHAKRTSDCHDVECLIVRSRDGGMVTRNCLAYGKPDYIRETDFPRLPCPLCITPFVIEKTDGTNYHYACKTCQKAVKVADIVPDWSEKFRYHGIAAFGDYSSAN